MKRGSLRSKCLAQESINYNTLTLAKARTWSTRSSGGGGGGHSLIWPIRGRAAGQGMVFGLSALNRVYSFMRTCPRQGLNLS